MSTKQNNTRKSVPRIVRKLWDSGVGIDVAREDKFVTKHGLDIDYHWETLTDRHRDDK